VQALLVCSDVIRQNFHRHGSIQFGVLGQIDIAHPARANLRADFVTAEFCS
jgi:hypothetical protein